MPTFSVNVHDAVFLISLVILHYGNTIWDLTGGDNTSQDKFLEEVCTSYVCGTRNGVSDGLPFWFLFTIPA